VSALRADRYVHSASRGSLCVAAQGRVPRQRRPAEAPGNGGRFYVYLEVRLVKKNVPTPGPEAEGPSSLDGAAVLVSCAPLIKQRGTCRYRAFPSSFEILPSAMPSTSTPTAAVPSTAAMAATLAVTSTFMASTLAMAFTFMPSVLAMAFTFMPFVSVPPFPFVSPCAISIVSDPPIGRPTVVWPPVPKTIRPQAPIIPVFKALVVTHRVQIGLLHVVYHLIGDALIAQLCQLRCRQAIDGLRFAHVVEDGVGRHTCLTHLDHFTDRDRRRGLFHSKGRTPTQQGHADQ
jgi:hypothetical protein